jgi:TetR/AcrR family transcriptional regulator
MANLKPGERKSQILQTLTTMLEQAKSEKITTASLAARMMVSEAALYRHFASKAQMYEGLIGLIETSVFTSMQHIQAGQAHGLAQAQALTLMLLDYGYRNPGLSRVLIGEVLINEDPRLQLRMNQFYARVEEALQQTLRNGGMAQSGSTARANLIFSFVLGRWHRFVKSEFQRNPLTDAAVQMAMLMAE